MSDSKCKDPEAEKARREVLLRVYSAALDEVRFNITLSWDRTKFFLLLNSGLIAGGIGLLKLGESTVLIPSFLVAYFLLGIAISVFGLQTVPIGKRYYREAVFTKTLAERELGLLTPLPDLDPTRGNLSIAVTRGQRDHQAILQARGGEAEATKISVGSAAFYTQMLFWIMIIIESIAAIASMVTAMLRATA
jgi:hypothetical protein